MTKQKSTKRALLMSGLALLMCVSMLIGSTFAWFTDSVTSGNNIVKSGNLDLKLSYKPYGAENTEWTEVDSDTVVFGEDALYEPGYTEAVWLKVENIGSLAFKYNLALNIVNEKPGTNKDGEEFKLSDYLEVKYMNTSSTDMESGFYTTRESLDSFNFGGVANSGVATFADDIAVINNGVAFSKNDTAMAGYDSSYVLVVISMPTTVGNEANHNGVDIPEINFRLTALATQVVHEEDSFDNQYDKDATYPDLIPTVTDLAGLREAMATGGEYKLGASITVTPSDMLTTIHGDGSAFVMQAGEMVLDLNGYDITVQGKNLYSDVFFITNDAKLTIKGNGNITADCGILVSSKPNSVINVEGGNFKCTVNNDMLYAIDGKLNVSGGTFETAYWNLINIYGQGNISLVDVSGGSFKNWNPASSPDGNLLAEGYTVTSEKIDEATWYTVVAE